MVPEERCASCGKRVDFDHHLHQLDTHVDRVKQVRCLELGRILAAESLYRESVWLVSACLSACLLITHPPPPILSVKKNHFDLTFCVFWRLSLLS